MKRLIHLIKLPTTKEVIVNTFGNYLNVLFTAFYALMLVRIMTPAQYGVLSILFAITYLLANVLDFGVSASIYSYLPPILHNREETHKFIKANFVFQSVLAALVIMITFVFIKPIDDTILKLHVPMSSFFWTFVSIPLFIWQNFTLNIFFAARKFLAANIALNIANLIKTLILLFFIWQKQASINAIIITLGVIGPLLFLALLAYDRQTDVIKILQTSFHRSSIRLKYTLTFFLSSQLFNMASRVDLFMLSFYLPKAEVGYYGLSQKIILTILTSVNSITQVLSPQFAKAFTKKEVVSHMKKALLYMSIPTALFFIAAILPTWIYTLVFTSSYQKTAMITRILSSSYILYGISAIPSLFFLYTVRKPIYLCINNLVFLIIIAFGSYWLIPKFGVYGPTIAFFGCFIWSTVYLYLFYFFELKKMKT